MGRLWLRNRDCLVHLHLAKAMTLFCDQPREPTVSKPPTIQQSSHVTPSSLQYFVRAMLLPPWKMVIVASSLNFCVTFEALLRSDLSQGFLLSGFSESFVIYAEYISERRDNWIS